MISRCKQDGGSGGDSVPLGCCLSVGSPWWGTSPALAWGVMLREGSWGREGGRSRCGPAPAAWPESLSHPTQQVVDF